MNRENASCRVNRSPALCKCPSGAVARADRSTDEISRAFELSLQEDSLKDFAKMAEWICLACCFTPFVKAGVLQMCSCSHVGNLL